MRTRWVLAPWVLLAACTPSGSDDEPQVGGESHWLRLCEEDAACQDGESCQCGVCARPLEGGAAWVHGARDAGDGAEGCVDPGEGSGPHCEAGPAEVYAVIEGDEVVARFCAPSPGAAAPLEERAPTDGALRLDNRDSGGAFALGEGRAAAPVELVGERVSLLGAGAEESVVPEGALVAGNNARLSRLTVEGDLLVTGNNAGLAELRVTGDLALEGNGAILIAVEVLGDLEVSGQGAGLFGVGVGGEVRFMREVDQCQGCYSFEDRDADGRFLPEERGESLCR
jgi:hypothetical protein